MTDHFELTLRNQRAEIARLQDELESFAREHTVTPRALHELQLAIEEHLTNVLTHGYSDKLEHRIGVRVEVKASELRVQVEDDGRAFNPLEQAAPDVSKPLDERPVGGLGIYMMRKSLDAVEYRREEGRNVLVMVKRV
jgi:serine/threonine-protein kinase RsbW